MRTRPLSSAIRRMREFEPPDIPPLLQLLVHWPQGCRRPFPDCRRLAVMRDRHLIRARLSQCPHSCRDSRAAESPGCPHRHERRGIVWRAAFWPPCTPLKFENLPDHTAGRIRGRRPEAARPDSPPPSRNPVSENTRLDHSPTDTAHPQIAPQRPDCHLSNECLQFDLAVKPASRGCSRRSAVDGAHVGVSPDGRPWEQPCQSAPGPRATA